VRDKDVCNHSWTIGTLQRELGEVERRYTDWTGKRYSVTEYHVPDPGRDRGQNSLRRSAARVAQWYKTPRLRLTL
jgi:hypothetical protein